jgi:hypothetical protein
MQSAQMARKKCSIAKARRARRRHTVLRIRALYQDPMYFSKSGRCTLAEEAQSSNNQYLKKSLTPIEEPAILVSKVIMKLDSPLIAAASLCTFNKKCDPKESTS